jgi:hypothetical protein
MRPHWILQVVLLLTFAPSGRAAETLYAGKPLALWMKQLQSDDGRKREEALTVLAEAGSVAHEAKPLVEKLLHSEPLSLRDWEFARAFRLPTRPVVQPPGRAGGVSPLILPSGGRQPPDTAERGGGAPR